MGFGNKTWGEDLILFDSYTILTQATEAYLRPLLSFSSVMTTFEIFRQQKFGMDRYAHTQFWN